MPPNQVPPQEGTVPPLSVPSTPGIAAALLDVQRQNLHLRKSEVNDFFNSKYVPLNELVATVVPILNAHGVLLVQQPTNIDGAPALKTTLWHVETDSAVTDVMPLLLDKSNPQGQGSAITYARRYSLMAALGLVADEDDDGNAASKPRKQEPVSDAGGNGAGSDLPDGYVIPEEPKASEAQRKKILAVFKKLERAGKLNQAQLEDACGGPIGELTKEGGLLIGRNTASTLIDRLERFEKNLAAK